MQNPITTCIWCDNNGKDVADFYCNVFPNTGIDNQNDVVTSFHIGDANLMTLNGGPNFKPNPSFSFFYHFRVGARVEKHLGQTCS
ncbi:MAG: hypothetical protein DI598_18355 [Pseudopedobacter saltans]|uniref:PhnB-like domain-containing protein n=1 Tax=Pseudopedobacter saltans TaxID=151895 RepID=A0A2W5EAD0_9SPHI|nr:MAG: hypothetical protein DI598_18355 [Pseudopedobacter saltans]